MSLPFMISDEMVRDLDSPETKFLECLERTKADVYEDDVLIEKLTCLTPTEKMMAKQMLENFDQWIHKMQNLVAQRRRLTKGIEAGRG